jgi:hypothetical protein
MAHTICYLFSILLTILERLNIVLNFLYIFQGGPNLWISGGHCNRRCIPQRGDCVHGRSGEISCKEALVRGRDCNGGCQCLQLCHVIGFTVYNYLSLNDTYVQFLVVMAEWLALHMFFLWFLPAHRAIIFSDFVHVWFSDMMCIWTSSRDLLQGIYAIVVIH